MTRQSIADQRAHQREYNRAHRITHPYKPVRHEPEELSAYDRERANARGRAANQASWQYAKRAREPWTAAEDAVILHRSMPTKAIAAIVGRSSAAVRIRRSRLERGEDRSRS